MQQHGVGLNVHPGAVDGVQVALGDDLHRPGSDGFDVVDHGAGLSAWHQGAVGLVGAVGDADDPDPDPAASGLVGKAAVLSQDDQVGIDREHRVDDRGGVVGPGGHEIAEPAMRCEVGQRCAVGLGKGGQRARLIDDVGADLVRGEIHLAPAEPDQVGEARVGADRHASGHAAGDRLVHGAWVAGVETAGDIGRGQQFQDGLVLTHGPGAEALAEIGDKIDLRHRTCTFQHSGREWNGNGRTRRNVRYGESPTAGKTEYR